VSQGEQSNSNAVDLHLNEVFPNSGNAFLGLDRTGQPLAMTITLSRNKLGDFSIIRDAIRLEFGTYKH
jgi:hypothetical protein